MTKLSMVVFAFIAFFPRQVSAQCIVNLTQPPPWLAGSTPVAYPKYSNVRYSYPVYICLSSGCYESGYSSGGTTPIWTALNNWQSSNGTTANNSLITFSYWWEPLPPDNTSSAANSRGYYIPYVEIFKARAADMGGLAGSATGAFGVYAIGSPPWITALMSGTILIADTAAGPTLTAVAAHEVGHLFALGDCYTCIDTVMRSITSTSLHGPSTCDNQQVRQTAFP